jgi:hypothetical protein
MIIYLESTPLCIYPLLQDGTCWFLAADFDKSSWQEDVSAFIKHVREMFHDTTRNCQDIFLSFVLGSR